MSNILNPVTPFQYMQWPSVNWSGALPHNIGDAYVSGPNGWTYTVSTQAGALSSALAGAQLNIPISDATGLLGMPYWSVRVNAVNGEVGGVNGVVVGWFYQQPGTIGPGNGFNYPIGGLDARSCGVNITNGDIVGNFNFINANIGSSIAGDYIDIQVDFTINKCWIRNRRIGLWNGDVLAAQNPNGRIGGINTYVGGGVGYIFAGVTSRNATDGTSVTINYHPDISPTGAGFTAIVTDTTLLHPVIGNGFDARTAQWAADIVSNHQITSGMGLFNANTPLPPTYQAQGNSITSWATPPEPYAPGGVTLTRSPINTVITGFPNTIPSTTQAADGLTIQTPGYEFLVNSGYTSPSPQRSKMSILSTSPIATKVGKYYFEFQLQFDPYGNSTGAGSGLFDPLSYFYYAACVGLSNGNPFAGEGLGGDDGLAVNLIAASQNVGLSTIVNKGAVINGGSWSPVAPNIGDWIGVGVEITTSDYVNIPGLAGNLWIRNITQDNALQKGLLVPTIYYQVELDGQLYVGDYPTLPNLALTYGPGVGSPDRVYVGDYPILGKVLQTINTPTNPDNLWAKFPFSTNTTGGSCFVSYGAYSYAKINAFFSNRGFASGAYVCTLATTQIRYNFGSYPFQGQPPPGFSPAKQIVSSGTLPPTLQGASPRAIPSPEVIPVDQNGRVTPEWARFFAKIYQDPAAGYPITFSSGGVTTVSPVTPGTLYINGGSNVVATIARGVAQVPVAIPINSAGQTVILYPGDAVSVTYTTAPQGYFLSS